VTGSASKQVNKNFNRRGGKNDDEEKEKEVNHTSHHMITTNHMESNFHLSNKKALYYNMKVYYECQN